MTTALPLIDVQPSFRHRPCWCEQAGFASDRQWRRARQRQAPSSG